MMITFIRGWFTFVADYCILRRDTVHSSRAIDAKHGYKTVRFHVNNWMDFLISFRLKHNLFTNWPFWISTIEKIIDIRFSRSVYSLHNNIIKTLWFRIWNNAFNCFAVRLSKSTNCRQGRREKPKIKSTRLNHRTTVAIKLTTPNKCLPFSF